MLTWRQNLEDKDEWHEVVNVFLSLAVPVLN